jgi:4-phospho-D-threonate 3-dehydrogenase / 4-phospho-D-erythronate 3-dehydrogenase
MGDPAGIGPEIIAKSLADEAVYECCRPVVLGDPGVLSDAVSDLSAGMDHGATLSVIQRPDEARGLFGEIDLIAVSELKDSAIQPGWPTPTGGRAMVDYIFRAVEMALRGDIAAMVTCPISKMLMQEAGYAYEGHTQLIAHLTETPDVVMMLAGERLRVTLVTIHCAIRDVPRLLTEDNVLMTIRITENALRRDFGLTRPRLAVAALNPHAGEGGLFGDEEATIIRPAVEAAQQAGLEVKGPFPADTLFHQAVSGAYDGVVAMYHDQGLIPLKLLHFSDAVNVTLGLPIIRTSVDHGTAYDIAGTGKADPSSLKAAIHMAARMARNRPATADHVS